MNSRKVLNFNIDKIPVSYECDLESCFVSNRDTESYIEEQIKDSLMQEGIIPLDSECDVSINSPDVGFSEDKTVIEGRFGVGFPDVSPFGSGEMVLLGDKNGNEKRSSVGNARITMEKEDMMNIKKFCAK